MTKKDIAQIIERLSIMHKDAGCELIHSNAFELLVAVILSAQCTDKRVNIVTNDLFKHIKEPSDLLEIDEKKLNKLIYSTGFYQNKAKNLKLMAYDLINKFNSVVPDNYEDLISLAGVGPKTASVVLAVWYKIPAMPVDTHVFRVSNRIGLSSSKDPTQCERDLKKLLPKDSWIDMHHYLIFHGRYYCKARSPECKKCLISDKCRYFAKTNAKL